MTFKQQIESYLDVLPSEWKDKLTTILCEINEGASLDCEKVKECETVTSLSEFSTLGSVISIDYTDEHGVTYTRSVDIGTVLNDQIENLDPNCLTDDTTWASLTYPERIQLLIDKHCDCCS